MTEINLIKMSGLAAADEETTLQVFQQDVVLQVR